MITLTKSDCKPQSSVLSAQILYDLSYFMEGEMINEVTESVFWVVSDNVANIVVPRVWENLGEITLMYLDEKLK
jgi:hypothetical protein